MLNIARLIFLYVSGFEVAAPAEAVQYYYILRNIQDDQGRSLFAASVITLAIDTGAYDFLFGTMQHRGTRSKGYLDDFVSANVNVESLANSVACELVTKGQFDEAINLYDLASVSRYVVDFLLKYSAFSIRRTKKTFSNCSTLSFHKLFTSQQLKVLQVNAF